MTKAQRLIYNFQKAAETYAFIGSRPPDEHREIKKHLKTAKEKLLDYIHELESDQVTSYTGD